MDFSTARQFSTASRWPSLAEFSVTQGLAGEISWNRHHEPDSRKIALDQDKTWNTDQGYVTGRGTVEYFHSSQGWSVYALSESPIAERVADLFGNAHEWSDDQWSSHLKSPMAGRLFWDCFPGAAIAAVHAKSGLICLLRDVLGFYPLYFAATNDSVKFSTSLTNLREACSANTVNERELVDLITFGQHYGSRTVWSAIDVVMPGHCVVFRGDGRYRRHSFANPAFVFDNDMRTAMQQQSHESLAAEAMRLVNRSLSRLKTDQPFVLQGGGGVDSSVLVALVAKSNPDLAVWSINHPELGVSEEAWTEPLFRKLGVTSRLAHVTREAFLETLVETTWRSCQPLIGPNFVGGAILRKTALASSGLENTIFVNGELCDTIFGGLSSFHQLAAKRRIATALKLLPPRLRDWIRRGVADERAWFASRFVGLPPDDLAHVAYSSLDRAELIDELLTIGGSPRDGKQDLADRLTWFDFRRVPSALHHGFYERDEWYGGHWMFPFADRDLFRFGFNLPWNFKYRSGHTKWLWRTLASELIGKKVSFRAKHSFDAPVTRWLSNGVPLLHNGFVADTFRTSFGRFTAQLASRDVLFWPLINIEIWGRLHCWGEAPDALLYQLLGSE